ncbi:hypothetical protein D9M69_733830 [compost metagenome]
MRLTWAVRPTAYKASSLLSASTPARTVWALDTNGMFQRMDASPAKLYSSTEVAKLAPRTRISSG